MNVCIISRQQNDGLFCILYMISRLVTIIYYEIFQDVECNPSLLLINYMGISVDQLQSHLTSTSPIRYTNASFSTFANSTHSIPTIFLSLVFKETLVRTFSLYCPSWHEAQVAIAQQLNTPKCQMQSGSRGFNRIRQILNKTMNYYLDALSLRILDCVMSSNFIWISFPVPSTPNSSWNTLYEHLVNSPTNYS